MLSLFYMFQHRVALRLELDFQKKDRIPVCRQLTHGPRQLEVSRATENSLWQLLQMMAAQQFKQEFIAYGLVVEQPEKESGRLIRLVLPDESKVLKLAKSRHDLPQDMPKMLGKESQWQLEIGAQRVAFVMVNADQRREILTVENQAQWNQERNFFEQLTGQELDEAFDEFLSRATAQPFVSAHVLVQKVLKAGQRILPEALQIRSKASRVIATLIQRELPVVLALSPDWEIIACTDAVYGLSVLQQRSNKVIQNLCANEEVNFYVHNHPSVHGNAAWGNTPEKRTFLYGWGLHFSAQDLLTAEAVKASWIMIVAPGTSENPDDRQSYTRRVFNIEQIKRESVYFKAHVNALLDGSFNDLSPQDKAQFSALLKIAVRDCVSRGYRIHQLLLYYMAQVKKTIEDAETYIGYIEGRYGYRTDAECVLMLLIRVDNVVYQAHMQASRNWVDAFFPTAYLLPQFFKAKVER